MTTRALMATALLVGEVYYCSDAIADGVIPPQFPYAITVSANTRATPDWAICCLFIDGGTPLEEGLRRRDNGTAPRFYDIVVVKRDTVSTTTQCYNDGANLAEDFYRPVGEDLSSNVKGEASAVRSFLGMVHADPASYVAYYARALESYTPAERANIDMILPSMDALERRVVPEGIAFTIQPHRKGEFDIRLVADTARALWNYTNDEQGGE